MPVICLDPSLLKKISQRTEKSEKYVREQISKRANKLGISSEAYLTLWAKNLGFGTSWYHKSLPPHIQTEVRSTLQLMTSKGKRLSLKVKSSSIETMEAQSTNPLPGFRYRSYDLHPGTKEVTLRRFNSRQYSDAVEAAFKLVIKRVKGYIKEKTGEELDGNPAMNRAFGSDRQNPLIKVNNLNSQGEKDEQRGIMFLFKGVVGIRNRKAHDNVILDDPNRAMEYLALASLLMRLLDEYAI